MKIMCDTNIIVDVLLEREPFVEDSCKVLSLCEEHKIDGFVSASSVIYIYYLVRKYTHSTDLAYNAIGKMLEIVKVCSVT
ncbi:MAG: PIN domain-containing protein, partial [Lachnospiraceae bacterium]|nr:PIN domain-containing protein [Lachnospiraceae bacterium]